MAVLSSALLIRGQSSGCAQGPIRHITFCIFIRPRVSQPRSANRVGEAKAGPLDLDHVGAFGSVARGENGIDSDVDLLYVLKPGTRLGFRLFDLEDELALTSGAQSTSSHERQSTPTFASRS